MIQMNPRSSQKECGVAGRDDQAGPSHVSRKTIVSRMAELLFNQIGKTHIWQVFRHMKNNFGLKCV